MKVLVVGGGGREHALAWKMAQSPKVQAVYVAPGNGGTALDSRLENIAITDVKALRGWAQKSHRWTWVSDCCRVKTPMCRHWCRLH